MRTLTLLCILLTDLGVLVSTMTGLVCLPQDAISEGSTGVRDLCAKVGQIKKLPLRRDEASLEAFKQLDPVYGEFRIAGEAVVPCLIERLTDDTVMDDPSQAPHGGRIAVGDVAFWVLLDITGMPTEAALPPSVRKDYVHRGMYAYFDWIRKAPANRKILQKKANEWHERHRKKQERTCGDH